MVVDDRVRVRRARAETVDGDEAERVRLAFLDRYVPARVRDLLARDGGPLGPGHPVVRLLPR